MSKKKAETEEIQDESPEVLDADEVVEESSVDEVLEDIEQDAVAELQKQLDEKEAELVELRGVALRVKADGENYKKRLDKEKADLSKFANERLLKELLTIHDNLDRALNAPNISIESLREGVEMILKEFEKFMEKQNVEPMESVGKPFDPNIHEVLSQIESADHEDNHVIQEHARGYYLQGRVLRPAQVVISKAPAKAE
ncbi:MAG: nucleotide exchange factor GrpE [Candidatus Nitrohelix vancouverensis]|uniref:Protein GrpE n=1 Tax=Candidatus Nitrohelix vancouverensis TaxID=2705534 RepID=A0A7T0G4E0_9BACT|nr:MAG: nucleotide exchange factor GrpE [Candidatus Nitrohelix vancouverensis]